MIGSWIRRGLLWCCRRLGGSSGLFQRTLLLHLLAIGAIAGALFVAASFHPPSNWPAARTLSAWFGPRREWMTTWNVLSIWAAGFVLWAVLDARRRLVLSAVVDGSAGETGLNVQGFGTLVATELSLLSELFNEFESGRTLQATPDKLTPLKATFQTAAPEAFVEKAVTTDSSFSLGPFKVPVGVVLSLVGRLVQGPRVTVQVYRDQDARIVTIRMSRSDADRAFSLIDPALEIDGDKSVWRPARELAHDVACQLYVAVAMQGTVNWRALASFAAGVRAYRDSLRAPDTRKLQMKVAERRLIEAVAEDPHFELASYNLGVVYTELDQADAASIAFNRAVTENNRRWSAYYALALTTQFRARQEFDQNRDDAAKLHLSTALGYCDQALALADSAGAVAQILSLRTAVLWWRGWRMWPGVPQAQAREFRAAGRSARRAMWSGWRALCQAELVGAARADNVVFERGRARMLASRYLQDLADIALQGARLIAAGRSAAVTESAERRQRVELLSNTREDFELAQGVPGIRGFRVRLQLRVATLMFRLALAASDVNIDLQSHTWLRWILLRLASYTLREARGLTPEAANIHLSLGVAYLERGRDTRAIGALEIAARLAPGHADAWGFLARALMNRTRATSTYEAARRVFENLHNVSDDALAALGLAMTRHQALVDEVRAFRDQRERAKTSGAGPSKLWFYRRFARLSYALADCDLQQMSVGSEMLRQYLNNPMLFDLATAAIRRTADRAGGYRVFLRGVDAERAKGEAGIEPLQLLLDQQRQAQHDWEAGHVGVVLAGVYERAARPAEAETILRDTISRLEHALPGEVQRRGLYAVLSRILRQQQKYGDALEQAKIGVLKDPVSTFERIELGSAYSDLAEYVSAQSAFEIASKINAEDPGAHFGLVSVHMQQVEDETTKAERKKRLERAAEQVAILLDLLAPTDSRRTTVHFTLARVHAWGGRYGAAIRELRALNRRKERDLAVELYLADAYLSCERWVDAEQQFRGVAHQVEGLMTNAAGKGDEPVPSPLGEKMVLGSVEAFARLGIAATLVERHIYLDEALTEVTRARASVDALSDIDLKREWVASCNFWEGAILLQQDRLDKAVSSLEAAVAAKSDAASYFQLANALTRQAELAPSADRGLAVRRAMRYYDEAQRIDWTDELAPKVNQARTRALSLAGGSVAVAAP